MMVEYIDGEWVTEPMGGDRMGGIRGLLQGQMHVVMFRRLQLRYKVQ